LRPIYEVGIESLPQLALQRLFVLLSHLGLAAGKLPFSSSMKPAFSMAANRPIRELSRSGLARIFARTVR
jgi:hypothetical protein